MITWDAAISIDPDLSREWQALTSHILGAEPEPGRVPLTCLAGAAAELLGKQERSEWLPADHLPVLTGVDFHIRRPLIAGEWLSGKVEIERNAGDLSLVFRASDGEDEAARMESRIQLFPKDQRSHVSEAKPRSPAQAPRIESLPLAQSLVSAFCRLSGDDNPIHASDVAAREIGLKRAVVPGMLLAALAERMLDDSGGELAQLRCRFASPVHVGDRVHGEIKELPPAGDSVARRWRAVLRNRAGQIASFAEARRFV